MSDKPKLTLRTKTSKLSLQSNTSQTSKPVARKGKRVITRDELAKTKKLSTTKKPATKPKRPKKQNPKKPLIKPSDVRADNLKASLNNFDVWLECKPLAIGIEKQVFQHIAKLSLPSSKRVVMRVLREHTNKKAYLQNVAGERVRFNLDGSESVVILEGEKQHALSRLAGMLRV